MHSNGFVYAVARGVLYKIDPDPFHIVKSRRLPAAPTESGEPNPENLTFKRRSTTVSGISSARMAIVEKPRGEILYLPGPSEAVRFGITGPKFTLDPRWTAPYLDEEAGDTQASSDVYMGNGVVFADNTSPTATSPVRIFA
jgi:hypothetical protein